MKNRKGFTLVEVIVVLVILAILAAILIPSMVKWIDKANEKSALVAGRTFLLAAQTTASELYAKGTGKGAAAYTASDDNLSDANDLSGIFVDGTDEITAFTITDGVVTAMTASYSGKTISYTSAPAAGAEKFSIS